MKTRPTAAEVRASFTYDPDTGEFHRLDSGRLRRPYTGTVNKRRDTSYAVLTIDQRKIYAHRAAWMIVYGDIPDGLVIDHINRNGLDNRLCNLRLVTKSLNQRNRRANQNNTTGVCGVFRHENAFTVSCAKEYIGRFATISEAAEARKAAERDKGYISSEQIEVTE